MEYGGSLVSLHGGGGGGGGGGACCIQRPIRPRVHAASKGQLGPGCMLHPKAN